MHLMIRYEGNKMRLVIYQWPAVFEQRLNAEGVKMKVRK